MISNTPAERRRRRPAVSCALCRRRKIRCNRESPCSNCIKSKSEPCVYDSNDALRPQQHLGFRHTLELDLAKASSHSALAPQPQHAPQAPQVPPQVVRQEMLPPSANVSRDPSAASRSVPSSSKGSSSRTSLSAISEVESLRSKIQRLEEQLSKVSQESRASPRPDVQPDIETATSGIAGTFHINRENRIDDERHAVSKTVVMHKSRLFGPSHWAQGASMFRELFELIEPFIRNGDSKAVTGLKRCKELARVIKAQRTPQWPTPPTSDLPPKGIADELVDCYLGTIETTFRILHIPSFRTDYDALWVTDAKPSTAFTVQLKLVLALGAVTHDDYFSMRPSAVRWVYEAHTWLSDPDFKPQLNIQCLQSRVLLMLARECINVGGDSTWISAGALVRMALYMGLHRDPSHLPNRTTLGAEMRRRLWNTIMELTLQASIVSGGAPLLSLSDFDCEPPGNFDDEQLLTEDPVPKSDEEYTQTSMARALRQTWPHRLAIASFLNDLNSYGSYQETLMLDSELRESYRAILRTLRGYSSNGSPSPSSFETRVLDFIVNYYLCCAHFPFFELSLKEAAYAFSRKVVIESSLKLWCDTYPSSPLVTSLPSNNEPVSNQDTLTRMVTCGFGFFRLGSMISTMFVALELKAQLQDEDSLGPNPYRRDLFSLVSEAKARLWTTIECGETNIKGYLLASMITTQIDALRQGVEKSKIPELLLQAAEQAGERCLAFLEEKAGQGANVNLIDEMGLNRTPPFMGDWEFIMSDAFFNLGGTAEPISWVLNDESRPFMM
ncbi:Zn(II)2Cys6 transcription factor [Aspergillus ustus]|uniref:Zn(II)2Cys6 transcription factor n=1 Tax=Aspergillus ustus TaxID=40382 RepID=A0A0C1E2U3_ASPUT|nr:Zn(II)2Cys6 transcription factor [Aspergillus ustus]